MAEGDMKGYTQQSNMNIPNTLDPGVARLILTSDDIFEHFRHSLRGELPRFGEDKKGNPTVLWQKEPGVEPLMNEKGIAYLHSLLMPMVQRTTTMTSLNEGQIRELGKKICKNAAFALFELRREYELKSEHYNTVNDLILLFTLATLNRALNAGERNFFGKTTSRQETIVQEKERKGGWFRLPFTR